MKHQRKERNEKERNEGTRKRPNNERSVEWEDEGRNVGGRGERNGRDLLGTNMGEEGLGFRRNQIERPMFGP